MYKIQKVSLLDGSTYTWRECDDAAMAFELATLLHAATMGLSEDEELNDEHQGAYTAHIVNENGDSAWEECSLARCPSVTNALLN